MMGTLLDGSGDVVMHGFEFLRRSEFPSRKTMPRCCRCLGIQEEPTFFGRQSSDYRLID